MRFLFLSLSALICLSFSPGIWAQTFHIKDFKLNSETVLTEVDGVQFSLTLQECHDYQNGIHTELALLRITNTTDNVQSVSFTERFSFNDQQMVAVGENTHSFTLNPGETISGSCNSKENHNLNLFIRFLSGKNKRILTGFEFSEIKVDSI
jgi:hypothetical protein